MKKSEGSAEARRADTATGRRLQQLAVRDSGFAFDAHTGATYTLSRTGTFLLRALIEGAKPESLTTRIRQRFDGDERRMSRDVAQFVDRLRELGLLETNTESTP